MILIEGVPILFFKGKQIKKFKYVALPLCPIPQQKLLEIADFKSRFILHEYEVPALFSCHNNAPLCCLYNLFNFPGFFLICLLRSISFLPSELFGSTELVVKSQLLEGEQRKQERYS